MKRIPRKLKCAINSRIEQFAIRFTGRGGE